MGDINLRGGFRWKKKGFGKKGLLFTLGSFSLFQKKFKEFMSEFEGEVKGEIKDKDIEEKLDRKVDRLIAKFDTMSKDNREKLAKFFGVATKSDLEKMKEEIRKAQEK